MKLIASNQMTLTNLKEKAIERTGISFWHGLSAVKHPLGVYDCGSRDHAFGNEFNVTSGKTYTVRVIAKQTKGSVRLAGGIWYTAMTSGHPFDTYGAFTLVGELSEDGLGVYERKVVVASGKTKGKIFIQLEQTAGGGYSTAWRIYDGQVFDENGQSLVTDQNNFGALTSPMAAPDGTYIWKRTITYYTDGTNDTVWEYNGVGEKGNTGANGQTSHVHFAFADNATGGGFSLTTPKAYMGWYADFNEAASTDPTKYRWSKWKGDQGLPGKPGADGKTSYFHMAYADSADGRTGFSFKESGQQYQGYYTDFVQANSTDPTKYAWMDRRAGVEVSGRNLWIQSKATGGFVEETLPDNHITGQKKCYRIPNNKELSFNIEPDFSSRLYRKVTFSAWVKYENVVQGTNGWNVFNCFKHSLYLKNSSTGATSTANYLTLGGFVGTSDWKYITYTYDYAAIKSYDQLKSTIRFNLEWAKSGTAWVTGVMVQFGNVATGHVWAPEDIQADIDSKADQTLTQEQLNALAEKNNLIKAEMEAKASIDTVDKWITAYENYVKANDADKAKSEQALKEASERILGMRYEVNDLKFAWDAIDRFMSFQNEGLIIGKKDGSAYAKFSDDRISLFSGSSEVMYISQGTLNIANGIFTKTIQIGRFRFETHPADADMLVLRYLGG
uniref:Tail protein n=1 Tax=Siphoviridae sp. ctHjK2 TaxID=2827831 RepID=A0A8S5SQI2_9CAUD|nr:MAG TPA: tail protein [Siphoviridae sp. ctHjK2]